MSDTSTTVGNWPSEDEHGPETDGDSTGSASGGAHRALGAWSGLEQLSPSPARSASGDDADPDVVGEPTDGSVGHGDGGAAAHAVGPSVPPAGRRGFAILHACFFDDDRERVRLRERLSDHVYTRQVAVRYAGAKSKGETESGYIAVVDPAGRCVVVYVAGSSRLAGPETARRVRRALARAGEMRAKRTSRPRVPRPVASKRTSRRK